MPKPVIGEPAPFFQLVDLDDQPVTLDRFLGRTIILNFWSADCPWSERADRALVAWQDRVELISVAVNDEPPDLLNEAAAERGLRLVLRDPDQQVADLYGVIVTPQLFLIDSGGILRYQGAFDDVTFRQKDPTRLYLIEALEALLEGAPISEPETPPYGCAIVRKNFD
jgi:peroxiredoxin